MCAVFDGSIKLQELKNSSEIVYSQSLGSLSDRMQGKGTAEREEAFLAEEGKKSN